MSCWKNSIVTYMDLVGIKSIAEDGNSKATYIMRKMHDLVEAEMHHEMNNHDNCYVWNDSVLLLSIIDGHGKNRDVKEVMREADNLKRKIDSVCKCYAISVKGRIFPDVQMPDRAAINGEVADQSRFIRLKTSSYAMGNCFLIEGRLGKKLLKPWYIDGRIAKELDTEQTKTKHRVKMLPENKKREIFVYDDYLW